MQGPGIRPAVTAFRSALAGSWIGTGALMNPDDTLILSQAVAQPTVPSTDSSILFLFFKIILVVLGVWSFHMRNFVSF